MASTNKTTNLSLSQFIATDKPSWLSDYNADMAKIDAGYGTAISDSASAVSGAASASAAAQAAQTTANSAETRSTNNAAAIVQINEKLSPKLYAASIISDNCSGSLYDSCTSLMHAIKCSFNNISATSGTVVVGSNTRIPLATIPENIFLLQTGTLSNGPAIGLGQFTFTNATTSPTSVGTAQLNAYYDGANTVFFIYPPTSIISSVKNVFGNCPVFISGTLINTLSDDNSPVAYIG